MKSDSTIRIFYQGDQLHTELSLLHTRSLLRNTRLPLAERYNDGKDTVALLAADTKDSITLEHVPTHTFNFIYTPYGTHTEQRVATRPLRFQGEVFDSRTRCYPLGKGYRLFDPTLMRCNSPDALSPFGAGGINSYGYCAGDPINYSDPTGRTRSLKSSLAMHVTRPLPERPPFTKPRPHPSTISRLARPVAPKRTRAPLVRKKQLLNELRLQTRIQDKLTAWWSSPKPERVESWLARQPNFNHETLASPPPISETQLELTARDIVIMGAGQDRRQREALFDQALSEYPRALTYREYSYFVTQVVRFHKLSLQNRQLRQP